jgi:hypothetical protein
MSNYAISNSDDPEAMSDDEDAHERLEKLERGLAARSSVAWLSVHGYRSRLAALVKAIVACCVRHDYQLLRHIRSIRGNGDERGNVFRSIVDGATNRILGGQYPKFADAFTALLVDGKDDELAHIAEKAADAERQQLLKDTAATSDKKGGDLTQLDKRDRHIGGNANATPLARLAIQEREEKEEAAEAQWQEAVKEFDGQVVDWSKTLEPLQRSMLQLMAGIYTYGNLQIHSTELPEDAEIYTAICERKEKLVTNPATKWVSEIKKQITTIRAYLEGLAHRFLDKALDDIDALSEVAPSAEESERDPIGSEAASAEGGPNENAEVLQLPDGGTVTQAPVYGLEESAGDELEAGKKGSRGDSADSANDMRGSSASDYAIFGQFAGGDLCGHTAPSTGPYGWCPPWWFDGPGSRGCGGPGSTIEEWADKPRSPKRRSSGRIIRSACEKRKAILNADGALIEAKCLRLIKEQKRQEYRDAVEAEKRAVRWARIEKLRITPQELRDLQSRCDKAGWDFDKVLSGLVQTD